MKLLFVLLVTLCCLTFYVQTLPINCSSGVDHVVLDAEDVEDVQEVQTLFFRRAFRKISSTANKAKDFAAKKAKEAKRHAQSVARAAKKRMEQAKRHAENIKRAAEKAAKAAKKKAEEAARFAKKQAENAAKRASKLAQEAKREAEKAAKKAKEAAEKAKRAAQKVTNDIKNAAVTAGKFVDKYAKKGAHYIKFGGLFLGKNIEKYGKIAGNYIKNGFIKNTLKIPFSSLRPICQKKNVCAVDCSKLVPNCKSVVFFSDFVEQAPAGKKKDAFVSYLNACIKRVYDDPTEEFWMRDTLVKYVREAKQFPLIPKVYVNTRMAFHNILVKIGKRDLQLIPRYLATMSELFLSFQKMCHEDPRWKQDVEDRINQLLDNDSSIKQQFVGNHYLSDYFSSKLAELKDIETKFEKSVSSTTIKASFERVARNFKNAFIERVRDGKSGYVCECPKYMKDNDIFPTGEALALKRCSMACGKPEVSILEEIEFSV